MIGPPRTGRVASLAAAAGLMIATAAGLLAIWEGVVWYFELPAALLPTPRRVLSAAMEQRDVLGRGMISTGTAAVAGLISAVATGGLTAIALSQSRRIRLAVFPYVILLQTVPIVAIAPLLIIWSGYNFRTVVIVTVIVCLFPIINSVTAGLIRINPDHVGLFDLYAANRWQRLFRLQIPAAMNDLMIGTKTSAGLSVIGAIVAEFFVGNGTAYDGLGTLMTGWQAMVKTDALIAALFASAILGLGLFALTHLVAAGPLRRWTRPD